MHENNENIALNALICCHGRALMLAQGWPDHIDVVQCYPGRFPGWISIYARLNAAELVLYGNRYTQVPMLPGDTTQIAIPFASEWLNQEELSSVLTCLREAINAVCAQVLDDAKKRK